MVRPQIAPMPVAPAASTTRPTRLSSWPEITPIVRILCRTKTRAWRRSPGNHGRRSFRAMSASSRKPRWSSAGDGQQRPHGGIRPPEAFSCKVTCGLASRSRAATTAPYISAVKGMIREPHSPQRQPSADRPGRVSVDQLDVDPVHEQRASSEPVQRRQPRRHARSPAARTAYRTANGRHQDAERESRNRSANSSRTTTARRSPGSDAV